MVDRLNLSFRFHVEQALPAGCYNLMTMKSWKGSFLIVALSGEKNIPFVSLSFVIVEAQTLIKVTYHLSMPAYVGS